MIIPLPQLIMMMIMITDTHDSSITNTINHNIVLVVVGVVVIHIVLM